MTSELSEKRSGAEPETMAQLRRSGQNRRSRSNSLPRHDLAFHQTHHVATLLTKAGHVLKDVARQTNSFDEISQIVVGRVGEGFSRNVSVSVANMFHIKLATPDVHPVFINLENVDGS